MSPLLRAFPSHLEPDVRRVVAVLPASPHPPGEGSIGPVCVAREPVSIPWRIYNPPAITLPLSTRRQRVILCCLYSRHHNGRVREQQVAVLLASEEPWVTPFIVQLVGEYVIEILNVIEHDIASLETPRYGAFIKQNEVFWRLTRARVISYWNEYYRPAFPDRESYVGTRLVAALERGVEAANRTVALPTDAPI